jgi:hypothetical protein
MCITEAMQALAERLRAAHQVNVVAHTVDLRKSDDLFGINPGPVQIDRHISLMKTRARNG